MLVSIVPGPSMLLALSNGLKYGTKRTLISALGNVLVTSSNPKAILFFAAVFPQFIKIENTFILQSFILLTIVSVIAFSCFMIYAIGEQKIFSLINTNKVSKFFDKVLGITFIGAGVGLATSS